MSAKLTNIGILDWQNSNGSAIRWLDGDEEIIFVHGLWFNGIMNDTLIGTTSQWIPDFSEGPIINGQAAILVHPKDSSQYRVYHIDQTSSPGAATTATNRPAPLPPLRRAVGQGVPPTFTPQFGT